MAKRYFVERGVDFTAVDITADRDGLREMLVTTGQRAVPVVVVGPKAMVGWNAAEFELLLAR